MKSFIITLTVILLSTVLSAQHLFQDDITMEGTEGKFIFAFDTVNATRSKASFIYNNGALEIKVSDSSFSNLFSQWELDKKSQSLADSLFRHLKSGNQKDSSKVKPALSIIVTNRSVSWYKEIQKKLKGSLPSIVSNFDILALSDNLESAVIATCNLNIYTGNCGRKSKRKGVENNFIKSIPIRKVRIYINDGFIYSFNFDIDTLKLDHDLKIAIQPHQAFSIRYNLRHNMLANAMLSNQPAICLKRRHTSYASDTISSGYVFYIDEFLNYISPEGSSTTIFTTKDTVLTFNKCGSNGFFDSAFIKEKSLYSIINLDLFGDLVGFFDDESPNGLIQTELKTNFYGFRRPIIQSNAFRTRFTFLNKGEIFFRFSKLDNKNRYLGVLTDSVSRAGLSDTAVKYVHGYRLLEFQNIYAGIRMNLGDFEYRGGSLSFTSELSFLRTPVQDTIFVTQQKQNRVDTIFSPINYGKNSLLIVPGLNLRIYAASFMEIDLHGRLFFVHPLTSKINTSKSEFDEFYGDNSFNKIITPKLFNLGAKITVNLNNDKTRRLIIRGENFIDVHKRGNNFWQAHVGYSADLNKFITLNNPASSKN